MALKAKFLISWIVLSAVFITLSVSSSEREVEGHRCYWCGPLAEQVHRSQRAPRCNGDRSKVTVCDNDLPYCAIVAKSPPYVESRYCVKFYQDECYSLYCNTTKTWKVTCPCRGELCNGINTIRENEAFQILHKHNVGMLAKSKPFKRSLMSNVRFIGVANSKNRINNITVDENKYAPNETIVGKTVTEAKNDDMDNIATINTKSDDSHKVNASEIITEQETTSESSISSTIEITLKDDSQIVKRETTPSPEHAIAETTFAAISLSATSETITAAMNTDSLITYNEQKTNDSTTKINIVNIANKTNESNIQIDIDNLKFISEDLKTEIIIMSSETPKLGKDTKDTTIDTMLPENMRSMHTTVLETAEHTRVTPANLEQSTITETMTHITVSKFKEKIPTAEALQHSETPATKTTDYMFTTMNMKMITELATQETMPRNNSAVRMDINMFITVISIILYY